MTSQISRRGAIAFAALASAASIPMTAVAANTAAQGGAKGVDKGAITAAVEKLLGAKVDFFGPAPIPGLFEVIANGNVYYVDAAGKHIIDGHIVNMATRSSLTAQRKLDFERATTPAFDASQLSFDDAIRTVYGKPTPGRVLVTFEDPRCGFCRKLHQDLKAMKDLVVYTFPVSFLGPQSRSLNETIWCSSDRSAAWNAAMEGQEVRPSGATCDLGALDRNTDLARRFKVSGTPTMYTANGQRIVGAVGAEAIEQALAKAS